MNKNKNELIEIIKNFVEENNEDVVREFGDWSGAFSSANITLRKSLSYTDEDILNALRDFYKEYGDQISDGKYKEEKRRAYLSTIYARFESWNNALKEAGIPIREANEKIPEEELVKTLKEAYASIGEPFTTVRYSEWAKQQNKTNVATFWRRFGGWRQAKKKAGIK